MQQLRTTGREVRWEGGEVGGGQGTLILTVLWGWTRYIKINFSMGVGGGQGTLKLTSLWGWGWTRYIKINFYILLSDV